MRLSRFLNPLVAFLLACGGLFGISAPAPAKAASINSISAGDIAIIGFDSDDPDTITFVALTDIPAGEVIRFTDSGWTSGGAFRANEGGIKWTAPAEGISAGTVVSQASPFTSGNWLVDNSGVGSGGFLLSTSGDQILAFQGAATSPTFIHAVNGDATAPTNGWQTTASDANTSALPSGLVEGTTAVGLFQSATERNDAHYDCTKGTSGTKAELLALINNRDNWLTGDTAYGTYSSWTGCPASFTVGAPVDNPPSISSTNPADSAADVDVNTNITVTFSEAVTAVEPWYILTCGTETVTTSVSGSGAVYTIDPASYLPFNTTCTLTITGSQVTDLDGTADPVAGTPSISFTTAATDLAPSVAAHTPTANATGVALTSNILITFNEPVDTAADWYSIACASSGTHTAVASGGPTTFTLNPDIDFAAGEICTVTVSAAKVGDQDSFDPPNEMAADYSWSFTTFSNGCGGTYTKVSAIQGSGATSPMTGSVVTVEGIVTAKRNASKQLGGFFLQSLPSDEDANVATSEGIFVYTGTPGSFSFAEGDRVRLSGTVSEFINTNYGELDRITELGSLTALTVCSSGNSIAPIVIDLPDTADPAFNLEQYEGMLVTIPETLTVQQNYFQGRFGQVTLGAGGRIFQMNNFSKGGGSLYDYTRMIVLDDGSNTQNPTSIPYYPSDGAMRPGDTVSNLTGVLDQGRINSSGVSSDASFPTVYYRLHPTTAPVFAATPRPVNPPDVGGRIKVASANVLNYFPTLDNGSYPSGAPYGGSNTPRGANTAAEFTRQQDKLVTELATLNADVYGLMEIESWDGAAGGIGAPQALVNALNAQIATTGITYAAVADPLLGYFDPAEGGDYIQTAIIYKTNTVTPVGSSLSSNDTIFSRSPFAQRFKENNTNEEFIVVVNHLKSKGSCPASGLDADQGDGQGCWNAKRVLQATALLSFISSDLVPLDPDVLVIGDMNAYGAEDPINTMTTGGLVNQVAAFVPAATRYSYVFDGTAGYLDHALSTASFTDQIADVDYWHINADEPSVIDYNTEFKQPGTPSGSPDLYQPHPYRASDHDPVLIGLNLTVPDNAPAATDDSYDTGEDQTLTVDAVNGVLANDNDADLDTLTAVKVSDPAHGTLTLNADGSFTYIPDAGYVGTDSFTYKAYDGLLYSATATVNLNVTWGFHFFLPIVTQ